SASAAARLALGQHALHQAQALVIVHVDPGGDFGGGPVAAVAVAVLGHGADAGTGTEDGAERGIHGVLLHDAQGDGARKKPRRRGRRGLVERWFVLAVPACRWNLRRDTGPAGSPLSRG